jgi:hypothetical protein
MKLLASILVLLILAPATRAEDHPSPDFFGAFPGAIKRAKAKLQAGDKDLAKALEKLTKDADAQLHNDPPSVMEKSKVPPSGDKHDYISLAPYFWPDPETKEGLPYIRHDGRVNPESRDPALNDSPRVSRMGQAIETLSLTYYFTGDEKYAAQAAQFARVWFLNPATRMNPNFKYAQAVLGKNEGRGTGILEARHIAIAADAICLLAGSKSWTDDDQSALNQWLGTFLDWLLTCDAGRDEHNAKNNHGTWYDVQTTELALCLGRIDLARQIVEDAKHRRVAAQIEPDGSQPLELARTNSFGYSRFNVDALCELANLGQHAGVDLWHFSTDDGRSIRKAIDYLTPYVDVPPKKWTREQIKDMQQADILPDLRLAALAYGDSKYEAIITKYPDAAGKRFQLVYCK